MSADKRVAKSPFPLDLVFGVDGLAENSPEGDAVRARTLKLITMVRIEVSKRAHSDTSKRKKKKHTLPLVPVWSLTYSVVQVFPCQCNDREFLVRLVPTLPIFLCVASVS